MSVNKGDQINSLRKRISKIDVEIEEIKAEQRRQSTQINQLLAERQRLNETVESLIPKQLNVTDHALLRYLERVMGIDIEGIRNTIVNDKVQAIVDTLGDSKVPLGDGVYAVVKNHNVVTIATTEMVVKKPSQGKRTPRDKDRSANGDDLLYAGE
jgi:seryl-tRNA synthetase